MTSAPTNWSLNVAQLAVATLVLSIPLVMLVLGYIPEPYDGGGREHPELPEVEGLLEHSNAQRDLLTDGLTNRMWVRKWSIASRNWIRLQLLGFADTSTLVSGADGALFLKKSLRSFECGTEGKYVEGVNQWELLDGLAAPLGIDLFLAAVPVKATVHPEWIGGRAQAYSHCYASNAHRQREVFESMAGEAWIDHLPTLMAVKQHTGYAYYRNDTHWMPHAKRVALLDVYSAVTGRSFDVGRFAYENSTRKGGDLSRQLLLEPDEEIRTSDAADEVRLQLIPGRTIVLHDSFYQSADGLMEEIFADVKMIHLNAVERGSHKVRNEILEADRIIFSVAERNLVPRLRNAGETILEVLLRRNVQSAAGVCESGTLMPRTICRELPRTGNKKSLVIRVTGRDDMGKTTFSATWPPASDQKYLLVPETLGARLNFDGR